MPPDAHETDVVLDTDQPGFALTGLRVASVIRLHRLTTITVSLIRRELGTLTPPLQTEVAAKLRSLFGLR